MVKNLPATQEPQKAQIRSLAQEDPLEEGMTTHSSILGWETPGQRSLETTTVHGVATSRTQLSD